MHVRPLFADVGGQWRGLEGQCPHIRQRAGLGHTMYAGTWMKFHIATQLSSIPACRAEHAMQTIVWTSSGMARAACTRSTGASVLTLTTGSAAPARPLYLLSKLSGPAMPHQGTHTHGGCAACSGVAGQCRTCRTSHFCCLPGWLEASQVPVTALVLHALAARAFLGAALRTERA